MATKLALRRARARPRARAPEEPESGFGKAIKNTVITSAAALLVTALFGDLIVKRNVETYLKQREAFENSLTTADADFVKFYYALESRIRERRRLTQLLTRYAAGDLYEDFDTNYEKYDAAKDDWNAQLQATANEIVRITDCKNTEGFDPQTLVRLKSRFDGVIDRAKSIFGRLPVDFVSDEEIENIKSSEFCPTYFLTLKRGNHVIKRAEAVSVHEHFFNQNRSLYNYRINAHTDCQVRFLGYHDSFIHACFSSWTVPLAIKCIDAVEDIYAKHNTCTQFDDQRSEGALIKSADFDKFDYRWFVGKEFLRLFRESYAVRVCKQSKGFWARLLRWDCLEEYRTTVAGGGS